MIRDRFTSRSPRRRGADDSPSDTQHPRDDADTGSGASPEPAAAAAAQPAPDVDAGAASVTPPRAPDLTAALPGLFACELAMYSPGTDRIRARLAALGVDDSGPAAYTTDPVEAAGLGRDLPAGLSGSGPNRLRSRVLRAGAAAPGAAGPRAGTGAGTGARSTGSAARLARRRARMSPAAGSGEGRPRAADDGPRSQGPDLASAAPAEPAAEPARTESGSGSAATEPAAAGIRGDGEARRLVGARHAGRVAGGSRARLTAVVVGTGVVVLVGILLIGGVLFTAGTDAGAVTAVPDRIPRGTAGHLDGRPPTQPENTATPAPSGTADPAEPTPSASASAGGADADGLVPQDLPSARSGTGGSADPAGGPATGAEPGDGRSGSGAGADAPDDRSGRGKQDGRDGGTPESPAIGGCASRREGSPPPTGSSSRPSGASAGSSSAVPECRPAPTAQDIRTSLSPSKKTRLGQQETTVRSAATSRGPRATGQMNAPPLSAPGRDGRSGPPDPR